MRNAQTARKTSETDITLSLELDGKGASSVDSGCGFLDHMLTLFAKHGRFDLNLKCVGDTGVDYHHTVEDIAICLGNAFNEALADKRGITRYGSVILPMDESLVLCAVDISGRGCLGYDVTVPAQKVGDFDTELCKEFFAAFCRSACVTLHLRLITGENSHHIIEACFKAFARALRQACAIDENGANEIPSTKGAI